MLPQKLVPSVESRAVRQPLKQRHIRCLLKDGPIATPHASRGGLVLVAHGLRRADYLTHSVAALGLGIRVSRLEVRTRVKAVLGELALHQKDRGSSGLEFTEEREVRGGLSRSSPAARLAKQLRRMQVVGFLNRILQLYPENPRQPGCDFTPQKARQKGATINVGAEREVEI